MAAEDLSAADRSSLQAERGPVNMAVAAPLIFERGPGTTYGAVAERVAARLHLIPRYRQKLADPAFGMANPVWIDDDAFDLHWHLRHATLPAPGSAAQLADFVAREMSRRLDRSRPLWELHVIDGLEGGRVALLPKMHHALVDGPPAIGIGMGLLGPTAEPVPNGPPGGGWTARAFGRRPPPAKPAPPPLLPAEKPLLDPAVRALGPPPRQAATELR